MVWITNVGELKRALENVQDALPVVIAMNVNDGADYHIADQVCMSVETVGAKEDNSLLLVGIED